MKCVICNGEKIIIKHEQFEVCLNCEGSGVTELDRPQGIEPTESHNEVEADKLPFTDLEDYT